MIPFIQEKSFNYAIFSKYIDNAVKNNQWSNYGVAVQELEVRARKMLEISDDKAVIATCSGTGALHALVYGIRRTKESDLRVTTQDFNFPSASLGPCGGPIVVDFDQNLDIQMEDTFLVDYGDLIIVTNCFGHLQNLDHILSQAKKHDKFIIFVNAATPYSFYNDTNSCNLGIGSIVSLHHTKPIGFAEGGLIIVDKEYEENCRKAVNFGFTDNEFNERSGNYKMSELSAAGVLQWWDQFNIKEMVEKYHHNYFTMKYELAVNIDGGAIPNHADDKWFPTLMPWISHKPMTIEDAYFKDRICKKYYKPLRGFPNSTIVYDSILCYPVHEGLSETKT